jgi:EKC/KEOPS complex subunit CGI121/TPRKB
MSLETLILEHMPETHKAYLAFYRNVENAAFLHDQLLARNNDFEYAFIDASVVSEHLAGPATAAKPSNAPGNSSPMTVILRS